MAVVERQALLEALLQSIVNDFDLENKTKLTKVSSTFCILNKRISIFPCVVNSCQQLLIKLTIWSMSNHIMIYC